MSRELLEWAVKELSIRAEEEAAAGKYGSLDHAKKMRAFRRKAMGLSRGKARYWLEEAERVLADAAKYMEPAE
jgi:hypothetical protein